MPVNLRSTIATVHQIDGSTPIPHANTGGGAQIPPNEYNVDEYHARRRGLINQEKNRRFDAQKRANRTEDECKVDEYVKGLREKELKTIYENPNDLGIVKGSSWAISKSRGVQKGELFKLIEQIPKGAVLHCHMDATVDVEWLIRESYKQDDLFIRSDTPLTQHPLLYTSNITIRRLPKAAGSVEDGGFVRASAEDDNIFSPQYVPNTWVRISKVRQIFPYPNIYETPLPGYESSLKDLSGSSPATAFDAYLFSKMTLTPVPASIAPPIVTSKQAWDFFGNTFFFLEALQTQEIRMEMYKRSFNHSINDNICYVEARIIFFSEFLLDANGNSTITHADILKEFQAALQAVQAELPKGKTFDAKVIYSTLRFIDGEQLQGYIDDAISLKQQFPDLLVGFDLVGHEDSGKTLYNYSPQLLGMRKRLAELDVDLPFCFHAGETLGDGDKIDDNLYDALLLGSKRLGHAFSLSRHPTLVEAVRDKGVCVESCPISNQVLRYNDTQAIHPVLNLLAYGCPVALSHDDPSQFLNHGLSPDFYSILIASDQLDMTSLGVLARNSILHSLVPNVQQKQTLIDEWDSLWNAFIHKIASTLP